MNFPFVFNMESKLEVKFEEDQETNPEKKRRWEDLN